MCYVKLFDYLLKLIHYNTNIKRVQIIIISEGSVKMVKLMNSITLVHRQNENNFRYNEKQKVNGPHCSPDHQFLFASNFSKQIYHALILLFL